MGFLQKIQKSTKFTAHGFTLTHNHNADKSSWSDKIVEPVRPSGVASLGVVSRREGGFTLIEVLVVVAIIGLLASILLVRFNDSREKARITKALQFSSSLYRGLGSEDIGTWNFNEGSGTSTYDFSGHKKNGTIYGAANWTDDTPSGQGHALVFNGSSNYVNVGTGNNYFPLPVFSICAWMKTPGLASGMTVNGIFSLTYGLTLYLDSSGRFVTRMDNGTALPIVTAQGNLHDDRFHHLCLAFDGSKRYMYVDGTLKITQATTWLGTTRWPTNSATIGREINNPSICMFNGIIDDVSIYGKALTSAEINKYYAEGLRKYTTIAVGGIVYTKQLK